MRTVFGWSYGGLIVLTLANELRLSHVIAYEPIMAPFGAAALPDRFATEAGRVDLIVGGRNRGRAPYGTTFEDVLGRTPGSTVRELPGPRPPGPS